MNTLNVDENTFESLGLKPVLLESLIKAGFHTPSPIQKEVIPLILSGSDVIGHAQTGTGKTAAFALPALHMLKNINQVEVLVITPTRELASQVSEEIVKLSGALRVKTATIYGGKSFFTQIEAIRRGAQVVVATPGRLLDLLQGGKIGPFAPSLVIIDEADEMLDMGFLEDLQAIFGFLPEQRQTLMFSATMPPAIQSLAKKILKSPVVIKAAQTQATNADIAQSFCLLHDKERDEAVIRLFESSELSKAIIFCKTKKEVDRLSQLLTQRGQIASGLHGDMEQPQRESVIQSFRVNRCKILVATDVAARGLNIVDVTHVINYHIPFDAENYVHRIGRTGRAGRKGSSITFVTPKEYGKLLQFHKIVGGQLDRLFIPSKQEIRKIQIQKLTGQVQEQAPTQDLHHAIQFLGKNTDLELFSAKLLHLILSKSPIEGPETIGIMESIQQAKKQNATFERPFGSHRSNDRPPFNNRSSSGERPSFGNRSGSERPAFGNRSSGGGYSREDDSGKNRGRTPRVQPDSFGHYPKKKFIHPGSDAKKAKKFY